MNDVQTTPSSSSNSTSNRNPGGYLAKAALAVASLSALGGCGAPLVTDGMITAEGLETREAGLFDYEAERNSLDESGIHALETLGPFITANEVRTHVRNAGFPNSLVETLVRIAQCESSFGINSYAWGGGNRHTGLFQISDLHRASCGYGTLDGFRNSMTDPAKNSRCAYVVYVNAGYSLRPWDCY